MINTPIISLALGIALSVPPVNAHQFYPHPCGEKIGAPASAEHVDALSDDLLLYFSDRHKGRTLTILLSCSSSQALVVETDELVGPRSVSAMKAFFKDKHCAAAETSFEAMRIELDGQGVVAETRGSGLAGRFPFNCICKTQDEGLHRKTLWEITDTGLHPTAETVGNAVVCETRGVSQ